MPSSEKCRGCMSFCMQGNQLAINGPDGSGSSYPKTWQQWKDIKSYSEDSGKQSIIQTDQTLSAQSQLDLINYIKSVYNEGEFNPNSGLGIGDTKANGLSLLPDGVSIDTTSLDNASIDDINGGTIQSQSIIFAHHYNDLLEPLSNFSSPISSDPKGDSISNNATADGPVAGWPGSPIAVVTSGQSENTKSDDSSLIKATLYRDLYDAASKLMYHPYQCNSCNVYEGGGEWLEIVEAVGLRIEELGFRYDNYGYQDFDVLGYHLTGMRQDCSGYVCACLAIYEAQEAGINGGDLSVPSYTSDGWYTEGYGIPPSLTQYFRWSDSLPSAPGSIVVRMAAGGHDQFGNVTSHVEIQGENGVWSGGGRENHAHMMSSLGTNQSSCDCGWEYLGDAGGGGGGGGTTPPSGDGELVDAEFTGYYPDGSAMEGDWGSSSGEHLDPNNYTCAAPTSVPFNSLVVPQGTGTWIDGKTFRVNDRGGAIVVRPNGRICFDILCFSLNQADILGRVYAKAMLYRK